MRRADATPGESAHRPETDRPVRARTASGGGGPAAIAVPVPSDLPHDRPFDRRLRRIRRDRAAAPGAGGSWLLERMAGEIVERLDMVRREFRSALVLGCAGAGLPALLRARGIETVAADAGARFAAQEGGVQCDEDRLPFADGAFDLVVSAGALDSVNDLPGALVLIRRALKPDGLFLGAFLGAGSLPRLRSALRAAEEAEGRGAAPRLHPQIDVRAAGDLLARAGFALPVADSETVTARYRGLAGLVADLRSAAATNLLAERDPRPFGRAGRSAAEAEFAGAADPDGKTAERFDIVHLSGWAPAPDQPKPARRGSAGTSLASVLGRRT